MALIFACCSPACRVYFSSWTVARSTSHNFSGVHTLHTSGLRVRQNWEGHIPEPMVILIYVFYRVRLSGTKQPSISDHTVRHRSCSPPDDALSLTLREYRELLSRPVTTSNHTNARAYHCCLSKPHHANLLRRKFHERVYVG